MVVTFIFVHFHDPFFVQWSFKDKCRNLSFGLVTKVKGLQGCKVAGQEEAQESRQMPCKGAGQEEARESHHILPRV